MSAPANWSRRTSSLPSHTTAPPRTAIAVASGWLGLCTLPLSSRVVGTSVTPIEPTQVAQRLFRPQPWQGRRIRLGHVCDVDDLTVDVVRSWRAVVRADPGGRDQRD